MIDTIILLLHSHEFTITDPALFNPSADILIQQHKKQLHSLTAKYAPSPRDLKKGIYHPRLTLAHRFNLKGSPELMLKIELSLPKLLFGNNFEELRYKDFNAVSIKLHTILTALGIVTTLKALERAEVAAIHYAKNILLTDGSTPYHYINQIKESSLSSALDMNQTDYRNLGHSFRWHCNAYEIVFYDKIRDLEQAKKSSKRALEKDSALQMHLFDQLRKPHRKFEILRMEVRLNKRAKIKSLLSSVEIQATLTFKKLFKPAIAKRILLHYLEKLEQHRPILLDYKSSNDKTLFTEIVLNNPETGLRKALALFGLKKILESMSLKELQRLLGNNRSLNQIIKEANSMSMPSASNPFTFLKGQIGKFKNVKL